MILYTADRFGTLTRGKITLQNDFPTLSEVPGLLHLTNSWFPEGLSKHGMEYFINPESNLTNNNSRIEILYELVRRSEFPKVKSRFQTAIFATKTVDDAKAFANNFGTNENNRWNNPNAIIWKIETDDFDRRDMNLLRTGSALAMIGKAREYWSNTASENPFWEFLVYSGSIIEKMES